MRKFWIALIAACLIVPAGYAGYRGYRIWRQHAAIAQARQFLAKSDYDNAMLCVRQVLEINPLNVEANQLMAEFCEAAHSPNALLWRSQLVELQPESLTNRLLLARTALVFGETAQARKALEGVDEKNRQSAAYQKIAGAAAVSANELNEAEKHFAAAVQLEPTNLVSQVNLASLQLQRPDANVANQARASLQRLAVNSTVRLDALRLLAADAFRQKQPARALTLARQILRDTNSTFSDRYMELDAMRVENDSQFSGKLSSLQKDSSTHADRAYEMARWMIGSLEAGHALAWLKTLPPDVRTNLPVPIIMADCYLAAQDWNGLQAELGKENWTELECLRLAYRARAMRSQNLDDTSKTEFAKALKTAAGQLERLKLLLQATTKWEWPAEREDVLWEIVNRHPGEKWAIPPLTGLLYAGGKTRSLLTLLSKVSLLDPSNAAAKNNLAMVALLLDASEKRPHKLAREVFDNERQNPSYISTYAFSLYLQKEPKQALQLIEQINAEKLESPATAGYYGLILAANGNSAKSRKYLEIAAGAHLLPEETALFRGALGRL